MSIFVAFLENIKFNVKSCGRSCGRICRKIEEKIAFEIERANLTGLSRFEQEVRRLKNAKNLRV